MVEDTKKTAVKKATASKKVVAVDSSDKAAKVVAKKAPAVKKAAVEASVWPFPEVKKAVEAKPAKKAAAKKESAKKESVEKAPAKKAAAKKVAAPKSAAKQAIAQPSAQERYRMVETAAYYIAERSGFQGCTSEHWAQAEVEISAKLAS